MTPSLLSNYRQGQNLRRMASVLNERDVRRIACRLERFMSVTFSVISILLFQKRWFLIYRFSILFCFLCVETHLIFLLHSTLEPRLCAGRMDVWRSIQWWICVNVMSRVDVLCLFPSDADVKTTQPRDWSGLCFRKFLASKWRWVAILCYLMVHVCY